MKEINLIPQEAKGRFAERWMRIRLFARRLPTIIGAAVALFIIFSVWQISAVYRYRWMSSNAEKALIHARAQLVQASADAARIQQEKDDTLREIARMQSKLLVLEEAKKGEVIWAPILVRLARLVPEEVWLNDILLNKDALTLKGSAFDNSAVSAFMVSLDKGGFRNTSFNYTQKVKVDDTGVINFEVVTQLRR